mmetsp:Transcript_46383/g.145515  ORF Transcript_46383/g.145515 Transcript_46383/m.145515 type:complete len:275 (-) Transcript_46383:140-964(-)
MGRSVLGAGVVLHLLQLLPQLPVPEETRARGWSLGFDAVEPFRMGREEVMEIFEHALLDKLAYQNPLCHCEGEDMFHLNEADDASTNPIFLDRELKEWDEQPLARVHEEPRHRLPAPFLGCLAQPEGDGHALIAVGRVILGRHLNVNREVLGMFNHSKQASSLDPLPQQHDVHLPALVQHLQERAERRQHRETPVLLRHPATAHALLKVVGVDDGDVPAQRRRVGRGPGLLGLAQETFQDQLVEDQPRSRQAAVRPVMYFELGRVRQSLPDHSP